MYSFTSGLACVSCGQNKADVILVLARDNPASKEWNKRRFLCSDCRNLKSTRGYWKYIAGNPRKQPKWKCPYCKHDVRRHLESELLYGSVQPQAAKCHYPSRTDQSTAHPEYVWRVNCGCACISNMGLLEADLKLKAVSKIQKARRKRYLAAQRRKAKKCP